MGWINSVVRGFSWTVVFYRRTSENNVQYADLTIGENGDKNGSNFKRDR